MQPALGQLSYLQFCHTEFFQKFRSACFIAHDFPRSA